MALATEDALPLKVTGARVSDNLFTLLGVDAALGRTFAEGESSPGRERVAVLSDTLWRHHFGANPAVARPLGARRSGAVTKSSA